MSVLILDSHLKSTLAATRSLGCRDISVFCGSDRKWALASCSSYTKRHFIYPSPKEQRDAFINVIRLEAQTIYAQTGEKPVVFCFSDATQNALADAYEQLKDALILGVPATDALLIARNKKDTQALAVSLAIPVIKTVDAAAVSAFPVVVKNQESVVFTKEGGISGTAQFACSKEELDSLIAHISSTTRQVPLIQEFIQGDEYGVEMVAHMGIPRATFVHKRIRSLSPRGGAAVVKETAQKTVQTEAMVRYAEALIQKLAWTGPVMVEFKVHDKDSTVRLMEINGRFWGSLPLAVKAGVDFPLIAYRLARGKDVGGTVEAFSAPYVRTRHFLGDSLWLMRVLCAKDKMRPYLYPTRLRALWDFTIEICKSNSDTFSWNDPIPWLVEFVSILRR